MILVSLLDLTFLRTTCGNAGRNVKSATLGGKMGATSMRCASLIGMATLLATIAGGAAFAASAEKGKAAFIQHGCWQCHGFQGQGGVTGPKLAPDPIAIEAFTAFVRTTNRAMPPYMEAVLSNEELADIHAYLESIPKSADYKSIPLL